MKYILVVYLILTGEPAIMLEVKPMDDATACAEAVREGVARVPSFLEKHQELREKGAQVDVTCAVAILPGKPA